MQALKPPPSSWQRKLTPDSLSEKVKLALVELLGSGGPESIVGRRRRSRVDREGVRGAESGMPAGVILLGLCCEEPVRERLERVDRETPVKVDVRDERGKCGLTRERPAVDLTITRAESPGAVPASPLNVGVESDEMLPSAGLTSVTIGATPTIVQP